VSAPITAAESIGGQTAPGLWAGRLVWFLRAMAALSMLKGLYHWAVVVGIGAGATSAFESNSTAWQVATIFFAVIDLVAAVGLWLAAVWGGVVWLTAAISMTALELFFPEIYGGGFLIVPAELAMIAGYVALSVMAARERPQ
jgi:hypothetical protein